MTWLSVLAAGGRGSWTKQWRQAIEAHLGAVRVVQGRKGKVLDHGRGLRGEDGFSKLRVSATEKTFLSRQCLCPVSDPSVTS